VALTDFMPGFHPERNIQADSDAAHQGGSTPGQGTQRDPVQLDSQDNSRESNALKPGQMVAQRYEVIKLIGCGGMGVVYKVKVKESGKILALKTIRTNDLTEQGLERFTQEAEAANALEHEGLIKVYEFGMIDHQQPYLVMDFIEGGSLADAIRKNKGLPVDTVLNIFLAACDALAYVHDQGIIHRDLKPGNILLQDCQSEKAQIRIADFGVAKILEDDSGSGLRLTQTGEMLGSPLYMSPEQCAGKSVDRRSDVYSLGCAMYEALVGVPPYVGSSFLATILKHQQEAPPSLASSGNQFPQELESVVARALAKDPNDRFQYMQDFGLAVSGVKRSLREGKERGFPFIGKIMRSTTKVPLPVVIAIGLVTASASSGVTALVLRLNSERSKTMAVPRSASSSFLSLSGDNGKQLDSSDTDDSNKTIIVAGQRILHFPNTKSMGRLSAHLPGEKPHPAGHATGTRSFPAATLLRLVPSWYACEDLDLFRRFGPDDFEGIDFATTPVSDSGLAYVARFTGLRNLMLSSTDITDGGLSSILDLPNLQELSISNTSVSSDGVSSLKKLKSLTRLWLCHMRVDEKMLAYLKSARKLQFLALGHTHMCDDDLAALSNLPSLEILRLEDNPQITDRGLKYLVNLPELRCLSLTGCSITPASISYLKQMPSLRELYITKKNWTESQFAEFRKALPIHVVDEQELE
jgi:serine/threonine protein kinase